ncbi:MAG: hypothetical protein UY31_C0018G0003 [Candidatus Wolfebacteria bacterium GW2011_GWE1_48_7]|nr:MAG: hypothetical protein UX58_C0003G0044 [Candidatus Wolfebacteria bacterium GW2011_GWB2_46_69]KKU53435.1 MAG: hypothetical protein UX76_C0016G0002 [Candidatus Wolfebacteria bacterium GW2011_GWC1_47_103]KKU59291.1 MAG: hypothetical protein UX83_C0006G0061 [Candidatus Wolfebacteria bacterium GW2011_GWE2_47_12]KKU71349.1 MAG: hypothetical protein UX96_C0023G0003 [Candidatus Wolfebacteria bacterium GW2011_GWB1_47_243]KKU75482.1 MAG: hypothetical protein UY00_C0041G0009 [Candidatus Wolfebacteri
MESIQSLRAKARRVEGLLLTAVICTLVLIFIPTIGVRINAILQPLQAVLGK